VPRRGPEAGNSLKCSSTLLRKTRYRKKRNDGVYANYSGTLSMEPHHFFALPIAPLFLGFLEAGAFAAALGAGLVEGLGADMAAGFPEDR
jgi:hypothetical protein